jgi:hypothetical protein
MFALFYLNPTPLEKRVSIWPSHTKKAQFTHELVK